MALTMGVSHTLAIVDVDIPASKAVVDKLPVFHPPEPAPKAAAAGNDKKRKTPAAAAAAAAAGPDDKKPAKKGRK